ncbi:MAG: iron chelate uptake ABC transporter family permease subunit [Gammaproteobacteria bacterium]|jgi:zinc transport system permease protein|nr:iron chelate uptake ABC transporter family permease subunit [Gammaproteobacteria bacterium]NCF82630.1 iron chelate uptake ABC transporter family permease subunit [Pseudomonadota bacterium]
MDDFFLRALLGGIGVAVAAGPVGCFIIWRRMVYFGAALAHSALLGVALGFLLGIDLTVGIVALCVFLAVLFVLLERQHLLPTDTLLGVLAHVALAGGLVVVAFLTNLRVDLMGYLFGDILAVSDWDLGVIVTLAVITLIGMVLMWRSLLSITVNEDLAAVEGVPVARVRLGFVLIVAGVVAIGMKIVGMLLILSLIIIPAAAARRVASTPERMALLAAVFGALSVIVGLYASLYWDLPSGPLIVVTAALFFGLMQVWPRARHRPAHPSTGAQSGVAGR